MAYYMYPVLDNLGVCYYDNTIFCAETFMIILCVYHIIMYNVLIGFQRGRSMSWTARRKKHISFHAMYYHNITSVCQW